MSSIRLSEKHGVNPTMCLCFFCGEVKHLALLGRLKGDAEAPMQCVMDYEPCDQCKEHFSKGVALIEVTETQPDDGRPPIQSNEQGTLYPTGRYLVVKTEAVNEMFGQHFHTGENCFIDEAVFNMIMEGAEE